MTENNVVYVQKNKINGKEYVGKTECGLEKRWGQHVSASKRKRGRSYFHSTIRKHGKDAFEAPGYIIVGDAALQRSGKTANEILNDLEISLIARRKTTDRKIGYNRTLGGDGAIPTKETRAKMRRTHNTPRMKKIHRVQGHRNVKSGRLASIAAKGGRIAGRIAVQSGQLASVTTKETCSKGGRAAVEGGHLASICAKGGRVSTHLRYHVARGIVNPNCEFCRNNKTVL
jgi:hypothetical protein